GSCLADSPPAASPSVRCPRALPPFPTRRSSDLTAEGRGGVLPHPCQPVTPGCCSGVRRCRGLRSFHRFMPRCCSAWVLRSWQGRWEEHTSGLQSREKLVCRLPREKKKKVPSNAD